MNFPKINTFQIEIHVECPNFSYSHLIAAPPPGHVAGTDVLSNVNISCISILIFEIMSIQRKFLLNCFKNILSDRKSSLDHWTAPNVWVKCFHTSRISKKEEGVVIPKDSHYSTMGVDATATQEEIKAEYFKLSKIYHPDVNSSDESLSKFQQISAAYSILGDVKSREEYDKKVLGIKRIVVTDGSLPIGSAKIFLDSDDDVDYTDNVYRRKQREKKNKADRVQWVPPRAPSEDDWDPLDDEESCNDRMAKQRVILMKIKLKERQDPKKSGTFDNYNNQQSDFDAQMFADFSQVNSVSPGYKFHGGYLDREPTDRTEEHVNQEGGKIFLMFLLPVLSFFVYRWFSGSYFGFLDVGERRELNQVGRRIDGFPVKEEYIPEPAVTNTEKKEPSSFWDDFTVKRTS